MGTLRNKGKLATHNKENCEENVRGNLAESTNVLRSREHYITQASEVIEGRVTKNCPSSTVGWRAAF